MRPILYHRCWLFGVGMLLTLLSGAGTVGQAQQHWAFRKPVRPAVPNVKQKAWVRNPIDAFVLSALEKRGLAPSPPAEKRSLLRRVTFDLTGLPPTPAETSAFLADPSPDAYEKVVKRLLASPRYGERWAQHWLDVVRFAETNGYELDEERPQTWRYRDYVVRALNADMPYDRFLSEQIAGDEIAPESFEAQVATGFLRAGPRHVVGGNQDEAVNRQEWLTEAVTGIGSAVLGMTIHCARCHDHKYDPVSQQDYYALQSFLAGADNKDFPRASEAEKQAFDTAILAHKERLKPIREQITAIEKPYYERLRAEKRARLEPPYRQALDTPAGERTPEQRKLAGEAGTMLNVAWDEMVAALNPEDKKHRAELRRQMHAIEQQSPVPLPIAPGVSDVLKPIPPTHLLVRGQPNVRGAEVLPAFPTILRATQSGKITAETTNRRRLLARWLTQPDHPLTARVMMNRLWYHHFGRGIVGTLNDFGLNGERPSHPELLDWLAATFVANDELKKNSLLITQQSALANAWSLKRMHFLMVTSNTYRQTSVYTPNAARRDPENRLLWRMNRRRMDAEALRDSILAVNGTLNLEMGGPSVRVPLEPEVVDTIFTESEPDNLWPVHPDPKQHTRRSLYLVRKRNVRLPMLAVFDQPDMMLSCAARGQSVSALQSLTLLNSPFMQEQSRRMAERLLREAPKDEAKRVERLFALTLNRPPNLREKQATHRFLHDQTALIRKRLARGENVTTLSGISENVDRANSAAWADLCLATFNLNDFVMVR